MLACTVAKVCVVLSLINGFPAHTHSTQAVNWAREVDFPDIWEGDQ